MPGSFERIAGYVSISHDSAADNPQAEETVLHAFLLEGALQAEGLEAKATDAEMMRQFKTGELPMPSGPAYASIAYYNVYYPLMAGIKTDLGNIKWDIY